MLATRLMSSIIAKYLMSSVNKVIVCIHLKKGHYKFLTKKTQIHSQLIEANTPPPTLNQRCLNI